MNVGEAAEKSGVSAKMIRYYEEIGLLQPADRSQSGYRNYSDTSDHTLRFVRRVRDLGFPIERIRELLKLWTDKSRASHEVKEIALAHVAALEADIAKFMGLRDILGHLAGQCHGDERPECPILDDLGGEALTAKAANRN